MYFSLRVIFFLYFAYTRTFIIHQGWTSLLCVVWWNSNNFPSHHGIPKISLYVCVVLTFNYKHVRRWDALDMYVNEVKLTCESLISFCVAFSLLFCVLSVSYTQFNGPCEVFRCYEYEDFLNGWIKGVEKNQIKFNKSSF